MKCELGIIWSTVAYSLARRWADWIGESNVPRIRSLCARRPCININNETKDNRGYTYPKPTVNPLEFARSLATGMCWSPAANLRVAPLRGLLQNTEPAPCWWQRPGTLAARPSTPGYGDSPPCPCRRCDCGGRRDQGPAARYPRETSGRPGSTRCSRLHRHRHLERSSMLTRRSAGLFVEPSAEVVRISEAGTAGDLVNW